jgi:hypothetical protein
MHRSSKAIAGPKRTEQQPLAAKSLSHVSRGPADASGHHDRQRVCVTSEKKKEWLTTEISHFRPAESYTKYDGPRLCHVAMGSEEKGPSRTKTNLSTFTIAINPMH